MLVSGFDKITRLASGVIVGTQKLGNSFALSPDIFDSELVDGLSLGRCSPFSVAVSTNGKIIETISLN